MPTLSHQPCRAPLRDGRPCDRTATTFIAWLALCRRHQKQLVDAVFNQEQEQIVYYVRRPDGAVKIGTTKNLKARLKAFQAVTPVELLGWHGGGRVAEAAMHRQFQHLRLDGEWFRAGGDLLAHIRHAAEDEEKRAAIRTRPGSGPAVNSDDAGYALTVEETADVLRVNCRTIWRMIGDGTLPSAKIRGRRLVPTTAVYQLIDDNTVRNINANDGSG